MTSFTERNEPRSEYESNLELLAQVPIFAGLAIEPMKLLAYLSVRETFKPGEVLFQEGDMDDNAYLIVAGKGILSYEGRDLKTVGEGEFIGGLSLLKPLKRLFSLRADTVITGLVLSRERFQKTLEQFPDIGQKLFEAIMVSIHRWESGFLHEQTVKGCGECGKNLGVSLV